MAGSSARNAVASSLCPEQSELGCVEGEIAPAEEASLAGDDEAAQAHVSEASGRHHNVHSRRCAGDEEA